MALIFLILLFHGIVVVLFKKIKIIHSSPPILVMSYVYMWCSLHFPRRQMGSGLSKPRLPSTVYYNYRIVLCLAWSYCNTVNTMLLFQIQTIQNWLNSLYLCYAAVYRKTGRYWFWCWISLYSLLSLNT